MAQPNNVKPGDLIEAAQWNALVAAVQALSGTVSPAGISVPSLFGLTLGNAVAILTLPTTQLAVGSIVDSLGNAVDPTLVDSKPLIVLNQVPPPSTNVLAGTGVSLVVAPKPGSAPPPPVFPSISGFKPTQVPILTPVEIDGGIDLTNVGRVVSAGARILVAGSAVFHSLDPERATRELKAAAAAALTAPAPR